MSKDYCYYTDRNVVISCYNAGGNCACLKCTKDVKICDEEHCRVLREQHCIVPNGTPFVGIDGKITTVGVPKPWAGIREVLKGKTDISYTCLNCLAVKEK
jgi:hypothetical protein